MIHVDVLSKWLKGNTEAIAFILALHGIVEIWDDLYDQDKPVKRKDLNAAFFDAMVTLPRNRFYQQHFETLNPVLENAILDWYAANALEARRGPDDLETAYILRCGILSLTVMSARIIGGIEWANQVNIEMRSSGETFAEYSAAFGER